MNLWDENCGPKSSASGRGMLSVLFSFFVFSYPLWPQYAMLKVFGLPGINFQRSVLGIVFLAFLTELIFKYGSIDRLFKSLYQMRLFFSLLCLFLVMRMISTFGTFESLRAFYRVANETIIWGGIVVVSAYMQFSEEDVQKHLFSILYLSSTTVVVLCLIEIFLGNNLFGGWVPFFSTDPQAKKFIAEGLAAKFRGSYRIQGAFYHPVGLAQFLILTFPFHLSVFLHSKKKLWRKLAFVTAGLFFVIIYFTDVRAAMIAVLFIFCLGFLQALFLSESFVNLKGLISRRFTFLEQMFAFLTFFIIFVNRMIHGVNIQHQWSNATRVEQVFVSKSLVLQKPFFGYGPRMIETFSGLHKGVVDSLFLSIAVESGISALIFLVLIFVFVNIKASFLYFATSSKDHLFYSVLGFALSCFSSALDRVMPIFFIVCVSIFFAGNCRKYPVLKGSF